MSKTDINKETLQYLAELARIELDPKNEAKLLADLQNILTYVSELQSIDTTDIEPMNGGTLLKNVLRDDNAGVGTNQGAGVSQFPETKNGYLKIPPVFKDE